MSKMGLPKGIFDKKIFVKISKADELNCRNIFNDSVPKLIENDPGMDFIVDERNYDKNE